MTGGAGFGAFVERVAEHSFGAAFAIFRDVDAALECREAAAIRRANAAAYLDARAGRAPLLLVGEAMGYAGGRFTGIAFTAERTLRGWGAPYEGTSVRPEGWAEQSGTIVHGALATLGLEAGTVLWNVVPAHPHRPGEPLSNRTPAVAELRAGAEVLGELIERLEPRAIVAVGRSAERALGELGLPVDACVRHPANGGATAFRTGLERYVLSAP
ncbi:MAG TPA: uracil-DNA glycosylase [Gaiellales bacterium]